MNGTKVRISILFVTVLLCVVWAVAVWEYEDNQFRHQTEALTNKEEINTKTRGETISADIQHSLRIGAALPELLATVDEVVATVASRKPSDAPAPQRLAKIKSEVQLPRIAHLNHLLALANTDFSADVVWVVDTNGDCIAASNFDSPLTFIGANYKERHYFTGAMSGDAAYQFAVGKVSHEPGLYFSAPIFKDKLVIGAVVVKVAIARLAQHIDFSNVFVVDENGVAVLAEDPRFEMKAVTGNLIAGMSYERRMSTYLRSQFESLEIRPWPGYPRLSMVGSSNEPYMVNKTVVDHGQLTIYVLSPAAQILAMNQDFLRLFVLLTLCGSAIVVIVAGLCWYALDNYTTSRLIQIKHDELTEAQRLAKIGSWSYDYSQKAFSCSSEMIRYFLMQVDATRRVASTMQHILAHVHHDDRQRVEMAFQGLIEHAKSFHFDYRMVLKNGEIRNISANAEVERDATGNGVKATGTLRDVTEELRARRAIEDSENHLRRVLNSSLIGIVQGNDTGRILDMNLAFMNLTGYSRYSLDDGRLKWKDFAAPGFSDLESANIFGLDSSPAPFEMDLTIADGSTLPVLVGMAKIQDARGEWVCFVLDLSERNRVNRIQSEFISVVSHELRTPLTSIRGSLALLENGMAKASEEQKMELIKIAHRNSQRLINIVNDILDMQKLMAGKMAFDIQTVNISEVVAQAVEFNAGFAQQYHVSFVAHDFPVAALVRCDTSRLTQVLTNLMSNAAKFSPPGGVVDLYLSEQDGHWRIAISDHGPGISDEFRSRIFGAFSQAENANVRQKGGTGLGLNITKTMVEKMGGSIGFESEPGQGATFWVSFPIAV